jgi:hypothetical protein
MGYAENSPSRFPSRAQYFDSVLVSHKALQDWTGVSAKEGEPSSSLPSVSEVVCQKRAVEDCRPVRRCRRRGRGSPRSPETPPQRTGPSPARSLRRARWPYEYAAVRAPPWYCCARLIEPRLDRAIARCRSRGRKSRRSPEKTRCSRPSLAQSCRRALPGAANSCVMPLLLLFNESRSRSIVQRCDHQMTRSRRTHCHRI